jgi:HAD superfamily hydrolase (TIGR01484 family)
VYFLALAADYDGTLATDGVVDGHTFAALRRLKETGRRLLLVTGRELPDLMKVCPELDIFDRVVAENGALIYDPESRRQQELAPSAPPIFVERLKEKRVAPLAVGRSIVATWEPHETAVLEVIRDLGLELQIIFNKGAVMVLPPGVNKATGLAVALRELELSAHNVVGVGDAENDHAFLRACGCSAAVGNALPLVKDSADLSLSGERGAGVIELIERICHDDAAIIPAERHGIPLGRTADDDEVSIEPHRGSVLIAGQSGIGKSTLATALTERMAELAFQFCVFDPEGDYAELEHSVSLGDATTPPQDAEVLKLLGKAETNVVVNTLNFAVAERPAYFANLLPQIATLRARTGRPHWLLIDEAHHLMPAQHELRKLLPETLPAVIFITVHPGEMSKDALKTIDTVVAVGETAAEVIEEFCAAVGAAVPADIPAPGADEVVVWRRNKEGRPRAMKAYKPRQAHKRHTRKYAAGDLGARESFYFRGPDGALNLRAQNLMIFSQIAEGLDDRTWEYHRRARDFSEWFRDVIKDSELASEAAAIEVDPNLDAHESRSKIVEAVARRYTAPASARDA